MEERVAQMPIGAAETGVKRLSTRVEQRPGSQPRAAPRTEADAVSRVDFYIATLAATGIVAHLALRYGFQAPSLAQFFPLYLTLILGGLPLIVRLIEKVFAREFGSDLLAGISTVVSVMMGQYLVGSIVLLVLWGGTALEM